MSDRLTLAEREELLERLRHCSTNTRDEYLHELTGRAADEIEALQKELASRPQWAGGQSPLTVKSGGCAPEAE